MTRRSPTTRHAFTIVEAALAVVIVGMVVVAALNAVGGAARLRGVSSDRSGAASLAHEMLSEVLTRPYDDPERDTGQPAMRVEYDDIFDYDGLAESPPVDASDKEVQGFAGFRREVSVAWVLPTNPAMPSLVDTGVIRIRVTVLKAGKVLARVEAIRTRAWDGAEE